MHISSQQEEFSRAYFSTLVTAAGFKTHPPATPDDDSIDLSIGTTGKLGMLRSPRIDIQLKCWLSTPGRTHEW